MDKKKTSFEKKLVKIVFGIELQDGQNTLKEITKVILQVAVIVLSIHTFFYKPFVIPSQSMVPTLLVGDYVFVSKFKYGFSNYSFPFSPSLFEGRLLDNAFLPVNLITAMSLSFARLINQTKIGSNGLSDYQVTASK